MKRFARSPLSSLTRWLSVVVGCAVLETAQPMNGAEDAESAAAPLAPPAPVAPGLDPDLILYPAGSSPLSPSAAPAPAGGLGSSLVFVGVVALGAAGFWLWRRRAPGSAGATRRRGAIAIEDSRALGNRQFLVVAGVDGRRFLLGVAPGNIRLLSILDDDEDAPAAASAAPSSPNSGHA